MPPRRGGRGRGMVRARPPQVIRESMQEIGLGSLAAYENIAKLAAAANADAARAYFPPVPEKDRVRPVRPLPPERALIVFADRIINSMRKSPHAIRPSGRVVQGVEAELDELRRFFKGESNQMNKEHMDDMWDLEKGWINVEHLPDELKPKSLRKGKVDRPKKKSRIQPAVDVGTFDTSILGAQEAEDPNARDPMAQKEQGEDDQNEQDPSDPNAGDNVQVEEEDDDLELDADYQTGYYFDDDEGYEENDSGAEEATF